MDLIGQLAGTLGIEADTAKALAGAVMGKVQGAVAADAGSEAADAVGDAVPELGDWKASAAALLSQGTGGGGGLLGGLGGGLGGGLLGAAAGALGGQQAQDTAALVSILGNLNIDAGKAALVAPLILSFLEERLDPTLLSTVLKAAPMLTGGKSSGAEGGLAAAAGMLGGMFGKN